MFLPGSLLAVLSTLAVLVHRGDATGCYNVETINRWELRDQYCEQPLFQNFLPRTDENELLDNVCMTYFPLPDDPDTFQVYISKVYCDGSNDVTSQIRTQIERGIARGATPFETFTEYTFGYAGCDTYLIYKCENYGGSGGGCTQIFGVSPQCRAIGLSCLRKVEEIVRDNCLPEQDYYVLPMKLPNRCVTQQLCLQPPNPFFNHLIGPGVALI